MATLLFSGCEKNDETVSSPVTSRDESREVPREDEPFLDKDYIPTKPAGQETVLSIQHEIRRRFQGITPRTRKAEKEFLKFWSESACVSMDQEIGGLDELARSGNRLPESSGSAIRQDLDFDLAIAQKRLPFTATDEEFAFAQHRMALAFAATTSGFVSVAAMIEAQDRSLPPKRADLVNLMAFSTAFSELQGTGENAEPLDTWLNLANDPNPIYRVLAIRGAGRSQHRLADRPLAPGASPSSELLYAKLAFMTPFLSESDPAIVIEAAFQIGRLGLAEGETQLSETLLKEGIRNNEEAVALIKGAIRKSATIRQY